MASIGLAEAARLTGRNQSTIHRAMKAGRLSYTLGPAGERQIDTAELDRVFARRRKDADATESNSAQAGELAALQRLLDERERTIADLRETIRDQRTRLDAAAEDRRHDAEERRRLLALLAGPRAPWWRRWFR